LLGDSESFCLVVKLLGMHGQWLMLLGYRGSVFILPRPNNEAFVSIDKRARHERYK
jgi:hypothetical protein